MRKSLRSWHARLGLALGLLLFIICATGTVAVLSRDIDDALDPARRIDGARTTVDWAAIEATLAAESPFTNIEYVAAPAEAGRPASAMIVSPRGQRQILLLHPETGELRGRRHLVSVQVFFRQLHKSLLVPKGLYIVTSLGVLLLFSLVSGLLIGKGWLRKMRQLRLRGVSAPVRWGDLHRVLGAWSVPFALIIAVTGVWYLAEAGARDVVGASVEAPAPHLDDERFAALPAMAVRASLPTYVERAREALPDLDVRMIIFPSTPEDAVRVDGQTGAWLVRDRASRVYLDPYDARVLQYQRAEKLGAGERWSHTADPLHFGSFGGLGVRILWTLLGAVMSLVVVAGTVLWFVRERARQDKVARAGGTRASTRWWDHVPGVVVGLILAMSTTTAALAPGRSILLGTAVPQHASAPTEFGPWRVVVTAEGGDDQAQRGHSVLALGEGAPLWRDLELSTDGGTTWQETRPGFRQDEHWLPAADVVHLRATTPSGERVTARAVMAPIGAARVAELGLDDVPLTIPSAILGVIIVTLLSLWATLVGWTLVLRRPRARPPASSPDAPLHAKPTEES